MALHRVLTEHDLAASMAAEAARLAPSMGWPVVAGAYLRPGRSSPGRATGTRMTNTPGSDFDHLLHMADRRGVFEHAEFAEPRLEHGYCTDDMARVLLVATREPNPTPAVRGLVEISLRFLSDAQGIDGDYRNRMSRRGRW